MSTPVTEAWLRGPIDGLSPLLVPAAYALIAAREDAVAAVTDLSVDALWATPGGAASVGFHLFHLAGATDRLMTYAKGVALDDAQKAAAKRERTIGDERPSTAELLALVNTATDAALAQLAATPESTLAEARAIGRAQLPTTVMGAIVHAAEHASRHAGQIVTTAKIVRAGAR